MTGLRLKPNSSVRLTDQYGTHSWFYVRQRVRGGYMFEPFETPGERRLHLDEALIEYYAQDRLVYHPFDESMMAASRLARSRKTWEAVPRHQQMVAERREAIIKEVKKAIKSGKPIGLSMRAVPRDVVTQHALEWEKEDFAIAKMRFEREKEAGVKHDEGAVPKPGKPFAVPCARTVWTWMYRYLEMGDDILALVRYDEQKGRRNQLCPNVEEAMNAFIDKLIDDRMIGRKCASLYTMLKSYLEANGLEAPSVVTFKKRIETRASRHQLISAQKGKRAADEARNIAEYVPEPEWALAQVEIDHTLANIHLLCDITGYRLGRPWITVVLDRLTRIILGCHVSFLAPSWPTLSRAVAHSIWLKDLSQFPAHAGRWDHHGVFDWAYTDRGMDFISHSGRRAGMFVGFDIANLPGFSPWLKGKVERCFGTLALQCYNYKDGLTSLQDPHYNPRKSASVSVSQFKADLIDWIIDYNHRGHSAHHGNRSPDDVWQTSIDLIGGVTPVRTVSTLRRMIGKSAYPMIGNHGMRVLGLDYIHPRMEELRDRHDIVGRRFEARYDPYNLAAIDFHDGNEWFTAHARRPDVADGVTAYQHLFHINLAKAHTKDGVITTDMIARVKAQAQTDFDLFRHQLGKSRIRTNGSKFAQYMDVGEFLTPINLIPQRSLAVPLEISGSTIVEDGRYLIPPRPDFEAGRLSATLALPAPAAAIKPPAIRKTQKTKIPKTSAVAGKSSDDRMRARLEESRKARGAS